MTIQFYNPVAEEIIAFEDSSFMGNLPFFGSLRSLNDDGMKTEHTVYPFGTWNGSMNEC